MKVGVLKHRDLEVNYVVKKRRGSKSMRIRLEDDGSLCLTFPHYIPYALAPGFIKEKFDWVEKQLNNLQDSEVVHVSMADLVALRRLTLEKVGQSLLKYNSQYNFEVGDVTVRKYKARWGCCDRKGNLTFNMNLGALPQEVLDYIVVHELCHIKEFNHSPRFWRLVEQTIPNYKQVIKRLKRIKIEYGTQDDRV